MRDRLITDFGMALEILREDRVERCLKNGVNPNMKIRKTATGWEKADEESLDKGFYPLEVVAAGLLDEIDDREEISRKQCEVTKSLLTAGARASNENGEPMNTVLRCGSFEMAVLLEEAGANLCAHKKWGSILHACCMIGKKYPSESVTWLKKALESARWLSEDERDIFLNLQDINKESAVHIAAKYGLPIHLEMLLNNGADPDGGVKFGTNQGFQHDTTLCRAAESGNEKCCDLLIREGAHEGWSRLNQDMPSERARRYGHKGLAEALENWTVHIAKKEEMELQKESGPVKGKATKKRI